MNWILFVVRTVMCTENECDLKYTRFNTFETEKTCVIAQAALDKIVITERTICVKESDL